MTKPDKARPTSRKLVPQPAGPVDKRRRPRGLTRAIKTAIDAMVLDRCTRAEACERAGISERAIYLALQKPEVAAHWNDLIVVLRTGERAHNVHSLVDVRDKSVNAMARVQAAKALEQLAESSPPVGATAKQPGLVFIINHGPAATPGVLEPPLSTLIDVTPLPDEA